MKQIVTPARRYFALMVAAIVFLFPAVNLAAESTGTATPGEPPENSAPTGSGSATMTKIQRSIVESEYQVTWQKTTGLAGVDSAWQAPNRANGFRTYFTDDGIRVVPRTMETKSKWELGVKLMGYGRGADVRAVQDATLQPSEKRMDYLRGDLVEWYVNDRTGLEQGFTLYAPPEAEESGPAWLVLALSGDLAPALSTDGQAIDFHSREAMHVLHYGGLVVRDANDQEVPAWMDLFRDGAASGIRLVFDDIDAVYPVTVDPLLKDHAWSCEGNQSAGSGTAPALGWAIAGAGNINGDGCCDDDSDGTCDRECTDEPGCGCIGSWHDFDDVVIGAPFYDAGEQDEGAIFVFHGSASGLSPFPNWMEDGGKAGSSFGAAVSGARDVNGDGFDDIIVGAPRYDYDETPDAEGMAFVFLGSPTGLDHVGGDIAGHPGTACPGKADWCVEGRDTNTNDGADDFFGTSVSDAGDIDGDGYDDIAVGFPEYDNGQTNEGAIYIFKGSSSGLPSGGTPFYIFERNEAGEFTGGEIDRGTSPTCLAAADINGDGYDELIVGVPDYGSDDDGGVVFVKGSAAVPSSETFINISETGDMRDFGWSVDACNINGDGCCDDDSDGMCDRECTDKPGCNCIGQWHDFDDVVVGDPGDNRGEGDVGVVYVFHGSPTGPDQTADWAQDPDENSAFFGYSVACAGDVNGDGYDDVIVGANQYGASDEGGAFLFHGSADGLLPIGTDDAIAMVPSWSQIGQQTGAKTGQAVAGAGDINGDGYSDVLVAAPYYDGDKTDEGKVWAYHGAPAALAADLVLHALERTGMICNGGTNDGYLCSADADCDGGGTCSLTPEIVSTGILVWDDSTGTGDDDPWDGGLINNASSPAVYYGSVPHSLVISTGLAQDEGNGNTDWGGDGKPDLVRWRFSINPPEGASTLRFTTQFLTSDIENGKSRDSVKLYFWRDGSESHQALSLDGVAGLGVKRENSPVDHGIRVDDYALGNSKITLIFEVSDGVDGSKDSALVVSNIYFSEVPLPEGSDTVIENPRIPEVLSNPSPQDTGTIGGTYSYEKTLMSVPGIGMPFEFSIRYNSASTRESESLGFKWAHSHEATLQKAKVQEDPDGDGTPDDVDLVLVHLGSGRSEYFRCAKTAAPYTCTTGDPYEPKYAGVYSTLSQTATGSYTYETKDHKRYVFDVDLDHPDGAAGDAYEKYALRTITDSNDNAITLSYDANKRLDYVVDTRSTVFTFNYDSDGRLLSVEHPQGGGGITFQHLDHVVDGELTPLMTSFIDLNGYVTEFAYDRKANILTCTDDDGTELVSNDYEQYQPGAGQEQLGDRTVLRRNANPGDPGLQYTFTGESVRTDDREGGVEVTRYDVKARDYDRSVFLGTDTSGNDCTESDDGCWAVSESAYEKVCVDGSTWCRGGSNDGDPCTDDASCDPGVCSHVCATDSDCGDSTCGSTGNAVWQADALGTETAMEYDGAGNLTKRTQASADPVAGTRFCVGGNNQGTSCTTDASCPDSHCGVVTEMDYDARNNLLVRAVQPRTLSECDIGPPAVGPCDFYEYDASDNLLKETNELGDSIVYTYTAEGLKDTKTDRRGSLTDYDYDTRGYLTKETGPEPDPGDGNVAAEHAYDAFGRRIWTKDPRGHESWFVYDTGGRMLSASDPLGDTTSYTYDEWDRKLSTTYPDGAVETYDYTPTGRLKRSTTMLGTVETPGECAGGDNDGETCSSDTECLPDGHCAVALKYLYDAEDRLVTEIDGLGRETAYAYDAGSRLVGVSDPAGEVWSARYDAAGNMLGFTDPLDHETIFGYDLLGRVASETDAEGNTVETSYNERGSIKKITRARDATWIEYTYDDAGQLTGVTLDPGGRTIGHTLDENGNPTSTTDSFVGNIGRTFDAYDRLKTRTDPFGKTIEYDYDLAGNLTSLEYSNGDTVSYAYDELNRLTSVTDWNSQTTSYGYDAMGNLTSVTLPGGSGTVTYTYDAGQRLIGIDGPVYDGSFTRDASGAITSATETLPLDPVVDMTPHTMVYDEANRLVERDGSTYSYDADGNLTDGTIGGMARTLDYDELNQLVQLDGDVYRYDADGLRVQVERAGGTWTRYVYDPTGGTLRLLEEWESEDSGGNWSLAARYVHGLGLISLKDDVDNTKLYHYDLRGSTLALTDPGSAIPTDTYAYDPYGKLVATQGLTPNPFTYNGRDGVVDDGTGLYFMRTRYYAPELMRFIQKDQGFSGTLDDPQSLNRYAYVKGDPIRFTDPNGEKWGWKQWVTVAAIAVAVVAAAALIVATGGAAALYGGGVYASAIAAGATTAAAAAQTVGAVVTGVGLLFGAYAGVDLTVETARENQKEKKKERQEQRDAEAERQKKADWSLDNLRKQIDDPNASWNRGLSVPSPAKPSEDPSDRPVPGPAPGGAS